MVTIFCSKRGRLNSFVKPLFYLSNKYSARVENIVFINRNIFPRNVMEYLELKPTYRNDKKCLLAFFLLYILQNIL